MNKIILASVITVAALAGTATAIVNQPVKEESNRVEVNEPNYTTKEPTENYVQNEVVPEPVVEETTPVAPEPVAPEPVVEEIVAPVAPRTFDEIIASYPTMSGTAKELACSRAIVRLYPEKFTPELMEKNLKLIADIFGSSCSPFQSIQGDPDLFTDSVKNRDLLHDRGQGDFWQLNG